MREFLFFTVFVLVAMAAGQLSSDMGYWEPFQNPGEIIPDSDLTIGFLIEAAGGIWQQDRVIDSMAYACTNVLPVIGAAIPEVDQTSLYWGFICDEVTAASEDLNAFGANKFCNDIIDMINDLMVLDSRQRREAAMPISSNQTFEDPLDIIGILINITKDLYGINLEMIINDISTINTVCTNIKENFLRPSLQDIITDFGAELMSALLPQAGPICQNWDGFLAGIGVSSSSALYNVIQDSARIGSQAVGYSDRDDLCDEVSLTLSVQDDGEARRMFSSDVISEIFDITEDSDKCSTIANDIISDVVEPLERMYDPDFEISEDVILDYTGFDDVQSVCLGMENAFTYVIDLPDPTPVQLIPETTLTFEFLLNAVGGIWKQGRIIDVLAYVCTDVLPDLETMVPAFKSFVEDSWDYGPICEKVQEAASNLDAFNAEGFCNDITEMVNDLISGAGTGERMRRQVDQSSSSTLVPLDLFSVFGNTIKNLYNININDTSTICPNIGQLLEKSLVDIATEIETELMVVYLPQLYGQLCEGFDQMLLNLGIDSSSPYYQVISDGFRIASEILGYDSSQALCTNINEVLEGTDNDRRNFAKDTIKSSTEIYYADRCSMYANDILDNIVHKIFEIENIPIRISDYIIYRYTGFMGVDGVCLAIETAFTELSTRLVSITITAERLNGELLVYTSDLEDKDSSLFKEIEGVCCGGLKNYINKELGSELRRLDCEAKSFSPGSIIADLELQFHALTEDIVDSLAQDAVELASSESLTLSSDGNLLTLSELQVAVPDEPMNPQLSTGAIVGIVVGVVIVVMLLVFIIICVVTHSGKQRNNDSHGRGIGMQNPGYSNDEKQRYA